MNCNPAFDEMIAIAPPLGTSGCTPSTTLRMAAKFTFMTSMGGCVWGRPAQ
jgi:hypothetical protein